MNDILNYGFVSPYVHFNFATGSIEPQFVSHAGETSDLAPSYFISLVNNRNVDEACNFTLTLMYVPGQVDERSADLIHQLLLTSIKQPVTYVYGYVTPGGGINEQHQYYAGIFTNYTESLSEGYLTYTITGISHAVKMTSPEVNYQDFIQQLKHGNQVWGAGRYYGTPGYEYIRPSDVVEEMITSSEVAGVKEYFEDYEIDIQHTDELVDIDTLASIPNGSLHDVIFGKTNTDGTVTPGGLVYYSYESHDKNLLVRYGFLSANDIALSNGYDELIAHGASSQVTEEMEAAHNWVNNMLTTPYICYFDNVVHAIDTNKKGSFHYVPKYNRQPTNIFEYHFGNSFIDGDVLSFSVSYDGAKALASVSGTEAVKVDIDAGGELIGSNNTILQSDGFKKQSYTSLSGFNESAFLSESLLSKALNYTFDAEMEIVGQIDCNQLMDSIQVNVTMNGVPVPTLTGMYAIKGIEDNLSSNGFTTKLSLIKEAVLGTQDEREPMIGNALNDSSRAFHNQVQISST